MTARLLPDGPGAHAEAIALLRAGGIVAVPTDTVYGIAADMALPDAIERLFAAKGRPPEKAVAVLLADAEQADQLGVLSPAAIVLAERLGESLALVLDGGPVRGGPASTVVDCTLDWPSILREGAIPSEAIAAALTEAGLAHAIGDWNVDEA